ncbi:hypothetical protein [Wohlfahrtiimonas chitiniclastica]|uniref:hypothetical protein n=1 Tax=Wohlfahrtiimonas chitiniclastica TaxID=400946 RepID=UPI00117C6F08|nr:hypothetical protein [Wohlfahrtiimonas chitiniclastica]MBS7814168.1 hypothetical protein [Wohlfahrtiimonas chitiniclastica]MBS7834029.1 hypothetical protein [Wohlfahrtiimonas chitiniclastica]
MKILNMWIDKIPNYDERFKKSLFERITHYGGGSEESKSFAGKHFSSAYELYIYAFFLGLYSKHFSPLAKDVKKTNFSLPIKDWGRKGKSRIGREDFTSLQESMFYACVTRSDIDWLAVDKGEIEPDAAVKILQSIFEAYTNGGLELLDSQLNDHPTKYSDSNSFYELMNHAMQS